jgi:hypothetical protein
MRDDWPDQQMQEHVQVHGQEWSKKQQAPTRLNRLRVFAYRHQQVTGLDPSQTSPLPAKTIQSPVQGFNQCKSESQQASTVAQRVTFFIMPPVQYADQQ